LPPREAALVRAIQARLEGREAEALRSYDALLAADPDDAEVLWEASAVRKRARDWPSAVRYLEKLVEVAPERAEPVESLVEALGRTGRVAALTALRDRLEREGPQRARAVVDACAWLGDHAGAMAAARQALAGDAPDALDTLQYVLRVVGDFAEAEEVARQAPATGASLRRRYAVQGALAAQGRVNEALRLDDESVRDTDRNQAPFRKAMIAAATGDPVLVWRHAAQAAATEPEFSADLAVVLLLLGDAAHAAELAPHLQPGGPGEAQYQALQRWRAGDATGAAALLAREEVRDAWPTDGVAPAHLLAEVAAGSGDDVGTLAAVDRSSGSRPTAPSGCGPTRGRCSSRRRRTTASARTRRRATRSGRLLALLARADRTARLVGEARALQARLRDGAPPLTLTGAVPGAISRRPTADRLDPAWLLV
jgi:tetratricopeptide (TPR) repeat protein